MAVKCGKCGYDNEEGALACNLCAEVLRKEPPRLVLERGTARFGQHRALPPELLGRLSSLAAARPGLRAVYLFTMSVSGGPANSAFGFSAAGPEGMRDAQVFLREADPHMPADLISSDLQCLPMDEATRADLRRLATLLLDR
ncbi:MAG: hypothetical protein HY078_09455 [Elusimicrobia bacterium]|nr:hypothetical protein [Elusimicrobiota bacterium]